MSKFFRNTSSKLMNNSTVIQLLFARTTVTFFGKHFSNMCKSLTRNTYSLPIMNCGRMGCTPLSSQTKTTCVKDPLFFDFFLTNTTLPLALLETTPFSSSWFKTILVSSRFNRKVCSPSFNILSRKWACHLQATSAFNYISWCVNQLLARSHNWDVFVRMLY